MKITGSSVLLTGASGGLGQAIARGLAERGAKLTLTARNEGQLSALAEEVGGEVLVADLADRDDVIRVADAARSVDVLVANAGIGSDATVADTSMDDIDRLIDVNLRSPIVLATAFAQAHLESGRPGQIVLVGSLSGLAATPNTRMYNATKFGLRGYSLALRQDLAPHGIGVTLVAPGFIRDAGMFHDGTIELPKGVRTKTPVDVADGIVRAIEANPAEVYVSATELRLGAMFSTVAPELSARIQQRIGVDDITSAG